MAAAPTARPRPTPERPRSIACQTCPETRDEKRRIRIRVSLFFDGTGNNRANTNARAAGTEPWHVRHAPDMVTGSYGNDKTNVNRLEEVYDDTVHPGYDHAIKIYVEGIGTVDRNIDEMDGLALGEGISGIIMRVGKGIRNAVDQIVSVARNPRTTEIVHVHLDSFGFSRGAAAARHFIHRAVVQGRETILGQVRARGFVCGEVRMRFCGLFDCVSSHGGNHNDDVGELNLTAVSQAEKTVHLCAAEEHRRNFQLTNIASAGRRGLTIYMPGVHSDVGGSYPDNDSEAIQIYDIDTGLWTNSEEAAALARERMWLIGQGWSLPNEIGAVTRTNEINVTRTGISNRYSYIAMQLQAKYAKQLGIAFLPSLTSSYGVPRALAPYQQMIERDMATTPTRYFTTTPATQFLKVLRHRYLHFSASYGGTNRPRWTDGGPVRGRRWRGTPING